MIRKELCLLPWVLLVELAGIYLFTKGFLLSRLALPNRASCSEESCTSLATHKRAVVFIVDALRFDFISSHPPNPSSPYYHNVLTLPQELSAAHPDRSFIFNAYADPPTTTLQRIKGLTTGSLPTFVDMGESFGGSAIHEDSLLHQLHSHGRKVVLAGDDTWLPLFPEILAHDMSYPFDSFDVEDLHTVDEGVIRHLPPLIHQNSSSWGLAIGHCLGVDHVGHRVGPDRFAMKAKLEQMDNFLRQLVELLDEDTLLVVLGDHGMDQSGNHGGDSILETSSALWIYSKGVALSESSFQLPDDILPTTIFPGEEVPHRSVQQIDLVPTLALLLGLPIPFNNLGSVIPELFNRGADDSGVRRALELNSRQIKASLDAYHASPSGQELDGAWSELSDSWLTVSTTPDANRLSALFSFDRLALETCRSLWAQFSPPLILAGLVIMFTGIVVAYVAYTLLEKREARWEKLADGALRSSLRMGALGMLAAYLVFLTLRNYLEGIHFYHAIIFGGAIASSLSFVLASKPQAHADISYAGPILLILHTLSLGSNSFTFWEGRIVPFLCVSSVIPQVLTGITAPTPRLRYRILGFSLLFVVCVRIMGLSTVCREEQQPYCSVTFYPPSTSLTFSIILLAYLAAFAIPRIVKRLLAVSKSDRGLAGTFLPWILTFALLSGTTSWVLEWIHSAGHFGDAVNSWLRLSRTLLSGLTMAIMMVGGVAFWYTVPVCLDIKKEVMESRHPAVEDTSSQVKSKARVIVLGFANAFGSPYLIFYLIFLSVIWLCTQLTGHVVLALATIALLAHLETLDSMRDANGLTQAFTAAKSLEVKLHPSVREVSFSDIVPLGLLALHTFHGTGHETTIPSLQWKTAFILTPTVSFPYSQLTVFMNTFGAHFLAGLAVPLLALWNVPPLPAPQGLLRSAMRASLGVYLYFSTLLFGSAVSAATLRRHLMVWKVFAPRYMFAVLSLFAVDAGILVGITIGLVRVHGRVRRIFSAVST